MKVHFGSFDDRFCGSKTTKRRFTLDENEVTCEKCKGEDRLILTPQGAAFLASVSVKVER